MALENLETIGGKKKTKKTENEHKLESYLLTNQAGTSCCGENPHISHCFHSRTGRGGGGGGVARLQ